MAQKANFLNQMQNEIKKPNAKKTQENDSASETAANEELTKFVIEKKKKEKPNRKSFPLYMTKDQLDELDKVCKKTGYNRNELINKMIEFCLNNMELK